VIKQQFDKLNPKPSPYLMPLVIATNTAARIGAATASVSVDGATTQDGFATWKKELAAFPARVDGALADLLKWQRQAVAKGSVAGGREGSGVANPPTLSPVDAFMAQAVAWICEFQSADTMPLPSCSTSM
jgi:hypothetical protein